MPDVSVSQCGVTVDEQIVQYKNLLRLVLVGGVASQVVLQLAMKLQFLFSMLVLFGLTGGFLRDQTAIFEFLKRA